MTHRPRRVSESESQIIQTEIKRENNSYKTCAKQMRMFQKKNNSFNICITKKKSNMQLGKPLPCFTNYNELVIFYVKNSS